MLVLCCGLAAFAVVGAAFAGEPPVKPPIPSDLIGNGDFETDAGRDGVPDGWIHSSPQHWSGPEPNTKAWKELRALWVESGAVPKHIPWRPPKTPVLGDIHRWESGGFRSAHAVSIDRTAGRGWGEWGTVVAGIKPNTNYVITGWRRQAAPVRRKEAQSPWLKIGVFGRMIPIRGTIDRDTWVPFVLPVHSGAFHGNCRIGLIVDRAPAKVWIDNVAMFEGTLDDMARFRLGRKAALLDYPVHTAAYASPDMLCPFFFDILWSFHDAEGDPGLEIVLELPKGLRVVTGQCSLGLRVTAQDGAAAGKERPAVTVEGRPYERWVFRVASAKDRPEFDSRRRRPVRFWLAASDELSGGTFEASYRARWRGGAQAEQLLKIRIIRIKKAGQPKDLIAALGGLPGEMSPAWAERLARQLRTVGLNGAVFETAPSSDAVTRLAKAGISPAARFRLGEGKLPDPAVGKGADGRPVPGLVCPSYRPKDGMGALLARPAALVKGGTATLLVDLRCILAGACCCKRCADGFKAEFQEVMKPRKPEDRLVYVPPARLVAEPGRHPGQLKEWHKFRAKQLHEFCWYLRASLDKFRKAQKPPAPNAALPLRLLAIVPRPSVAGGPADHGVLSIYTEKIADPFDFVIIEPNMYVVDSGGTPEWVGREVAALARQLPAPPNGKAGAVITAGSYEDGAAIAPVVRHADIRDQVLEAVVAGAKAVVLRPFYAVDGMDLKQFSDAIRLLAPFEEIVIEGEPVHVVSIVEGGGRVRCLGKQGQVLALVTDYAAKRPAGPIKVKLGLTFPKGTPPVPMVLVDVESRETVAKRILPTTKQVQVTLNGGRTRLFYLGPSNKLPKPGDAK